MLLTDDEISGLSLSAVTVKDTLSDVLEIEAAILAKLASAELLPAQDLSDEEKQFIHCNPDTDDLVELIQGHAAAYGRQAYAQGFAAGAASQLAESPMGWFVKEHGDVVDLEWNSEKPKYEGDWKPLYTRREAK